MKIIRTNLIVLFTLFISSCSEKQNEIKTADFNACWGYLNSNMQQTIDYVSQLNEHKTNYEARVSTFENARKAYKKIEPFVTYLAPRKVKGINGPPLPVFKEDSGRVLPAIGFQALEEQVFEAEMENPDLFSYRIKILIGYLTNVQETFKKRPINAESFFVSVHNQLLSIFALGISSFDTPVSLQGLKESRYALESIKEIYEMSMQNLIQSKDYQLDAEFIANINNASSYLKNNNTFDTFDRYSFTRDYLNPLTKNWRDIRVLSGLLPNVKKSAINLDAPTFFEQNSFNSSAFLRLKTQPKKDMIALGKELFFDPSLSQSGKISCASCHVPEKAYQDGLTLAEGVNGKVLQRNTPTIINSLFQRKFFWDGRSDDLVQQINLVFDNEDEFNRSGSHALAINSLDTLKYKDLVLSSFPDTKKLTKKTVSRAISAYVATLNGFNSKFDKNMRGETSDFTEQEKLGMNLYMGKALCATCHFLPLTSGTVPPNFMETEMEVIGVPKTAENAEIDEDEGFYWVFQSKIHKYMFKTPTIRNIEHTAPYMHNGVYTSLEQVMDFYNKGGGGGLGFDLPHQTLPFDNLNLTENEINSIIAFMKTLSDTEVTTY